jgi:hypothetical protein
MLRVVAGCRCSLVPVARWLRLRLNQFRPLLEHLEHRGASAAIAVLAGNLFEAAG